MSVSIKEEGLLLLDPSPDFVSTDPNFKFSSSGDDYRLSDEYEKAEDPEDESESSSEKIDGSRTKGGGPPADIELEKLPRPSSALNCRQVNKTSISHGTPSEVNSTKILLVLLERVLLGVLFTEQK